MEKRSILFIVLCVLIMGGWMLLSAYLAPPKPPVDPTAQGQLDPATDGNPAPDAPDAPKVGPGEKPPTDPSDSEPPEPPEPDDPADGDDSVPSERRPENLPTKVVALGSLDPASGYRMLATFTTEGAALKRLELNDPAFKDVDIAQGYLGHLELVRVDDGLQIGLDLKGTGTPAALAGLNQDKIITQLNDTRLLYVSDFDRALAASHPGDAVQLQVKKPDGSTSQVAVTLIRSPQQLIQPSMGLPVPPGQAESNPPEDEDELPLPPGHHPYSYRVTLAKAPQPHQDVSHYLDSLLVDNWELKTATEDSVVFERLLTVSELQELGLTGSWRIEKRFSLAKSDSSLSGDDEATARRKAAQHITWEYEVFNDSEEEQDVCFWVEGPTGLPVEGWWYSYKIHPKMFYTAGARDVVLDSPGQGFKVWGARNIFKDTYAKPDRNLLFVASDPDPNRTLEFIGVDTQYFAAVMIPGTIDKLATAEFRRAQALTWDEETKDLLPWAKAADVSYNLQSNRFTVAPGASQQQSFVIFAGPKDPELVRTYGVEECIYYGWFGWVSKPLLGLLHMFSFMGYGLAIILLTLLVRACLWPFSRKAARNAQMMQVIKPELDAIREKYKNDMEKQGQAQREIMAKYKVNPFGGCLLMFFQMPVFLGLYRGLSVDLALRDQPLIPGLPWAENLAAPDRLFYWGTYPAFLFGETGWLGPYLNILPLITVSLFIVQQKLFMPPATDEQTQAQQKMMNFMMIFMGLMFFKVPSGLCLYFITTSIFSIVERTVLPPPKAPEATAKSKAKTPTKPPAEKRQEKKDRAKSAKRRPK